MQVSQLVSFSHEQVELLREIAREIMQGGVSRRELAELLKVKNSQVSNFVRYAAATKRPKPQEFLLPLHNYVISQKERNILNHNVRQLVENYIDTLDPGYLGGRVLKKEYTLHFGTIEKLTEATLQVIKEGKQTIARLKLPTIGDTTEVYSGFAISWSSSLTAALTVEHGHRSITIVVAESRLTGMLAGILTLQSQDGGVVAKRCVIYDENEIQRSMNDVSAAKLRQVTRELFRETEKLGSQSDRLEASQE